MLGVEGAVLTPAGLDKSIGVQRGQRII